MTLHPGTSAEVEILVDPAATNHPLSVWDYRERAFVVPAGPFAVHVGTASDLTSPAGHFSVAPR